MFILEERRFRGDLIAFYSSLEAGCSQVEIGLFSKKQDDRKQSQVEQRRFRLDITKNLLLARDV